MRFLCHSVARIQNVIALAGVCLLIPSLPTLAQNWRGMEPMRSTCEDVQHLFGANTCSKKSVSHIFLKETVTVVFASGGCNSASGSYDVPAGTVTDILVIPRYPRRLFVSDLNVDKAKFTKRPAGDLLGVFEYISLELGMKFTASRKGQILDIAYFPSAKYERQRCPSSVGNRVVSEQGTDHSSTIRSLQ